MFANLNNYILWTKTHNSLFILTFDEDDNSDANKVATIFTGQMVKSGQYSETINHYSILRTIEDMYGLPYACNAATANPITDSWLFPSGVITKTSGENIFTIYPNPTDGEFAIKFESTKVGKLENVEIFDVLGNKVFEKNVAGTLTDQIQLAQLTAGSYLVKVSDGKIIYTQKLVVQ
jgi:hypothetical protein